MKFLHKIVFILILICLLTFAGFFLSKQKEIANSEKKIQNVFLDSIGNNQYSEQFNIIIQNECDSKVIKHNVNCFKSLQSLIKIADKKNDKNDCGQCMFNRSDGSIFFVYYHTFWDLDSKDKDYQLRVLRLNLMSYLITQK